MALRREAKRCCAGAGAGEQGLGDELEAATEARAPAELALADADADADTGEGDGDAPRRGSGELAALAATLVVLGDRAIALPRERGVTRAGAAATCESADGAAAAAAAPRQRRAPAPIGKTTNALAKRETNQASNYAALPFSLRGSELWNARASRSQPV